MTTATLGRQKRKPAGDTTQTLYRMTIGEHLEDLRWRMILGLLAFAVAIIVCVLFTERLIVFFCAPSPRRLLKHGLPPSMAIPRITEAFHDVTFGSG